MKQSFTVLFAIVFLAACAQEPPPEPAPDWDGFVESFIEDTLAARPAFAVSNGRHEYDGMLPDYSAEGIATEIARLEEARAAALAFDADALTEDQRFQRDYLVSKVDHDLFWFRDARQPFTNPLFYASWLLGGIGPDVYLTREYAPLEVRMAAYTRYASEIPRVAGEIRANLETPMPRTYVELGAAMFGGYAAFFRDEVPGIFAPVVDPDLQPQFEAANTAAADAMAELAEWFVAQRETATDDFALGEEMFAKMLYETERVDTPIDELWAIGQADLERNLASLEAACDTFAPGVDLEACVVRARAQKPEGGPVVAAREQLTELRAFLDANDIVSIPGTEEALVREAPPYARWNFAYIDIPGPYEQNQPSVYYIAPPDPSWPEAEQQAYLPSETDLLFVSVHEVWPGHFLNFLHANRADDVFGRLFVGYAFAEGWGHYTEEMMWEAGLRDGDAFAHIGQLSNALLRNIRYLCAIGMHTRGMTVDECETMFRERGFQDPGNARQQAARGTFDPAYLNYTMGKLMIMRLREDWTATRGGRDAWKAFHDEFLGYGGPPIPLVRGAMLGEEPKAAF